MGTTRSIATGDDWTLSIAELTRPADFSHLPAMERIFTIVDGDGVRLTVDDVAHEVRRHEPFAFSGGATTRVEVPHGPARALNVMVRRRAMTALVEIITLTPEHPYDQMQGQFALVLQGSLEVRHPSYQGHLDPFDSILVYDDMAPFTLSGSALIALTTLTNISLCNGVKS